MTTPTLDTSRSASRLERRKARTRAAILEAARKLFQEQGFESTSIAQIAEAADSGVGTLYGYFSNKDDILHEVLRAHGEQVTREFLESVNESTPMLERIVMALGVCVRYLRENRILLHSAFQVDSRSPNAEGNPNAWLIRQFAMMIRTGAERGEVADLPPETTARSLVSIYTMSMLGIGHWRGFEDDERTACELEAMVRQMLTP